MVTVEVLRAELNVLRAQNEVLRYIIRKERAQYAKHGVVQLSCLVEGELGLVPAKENENENAI